jgi:hypothetical protein
MPDEIGGENHSLAFEEAHPSPHPHLERLRPAGRGRAMQPCAVPGSSPGGMTRVTYREVMQKGKVHFVSLNALPKSVL